MRRHSRAHIYHQRRRHISRRLRFLRRAWGWVPDRPGRLSKWNLVCSCWLCRDPKYRQQRSREKRRWQAEVREEAGSAMPDPEGNRFP